jgi:hypothetical protein
VRSSCAPCLSDKDCAPRESCAQFGGDIYCAATCTTDADCGAGTVCRAETSAAGEQVSVCVALGDPCGGASGVDTDAGVTDTGADTAIADTSIGPDSGPGDTCGTLVAPSHPAKCVCDPSLHPCAANGCYGGWWCDTATLKCHAPPLPSTCSPPPPVDAGPGPDAGPPGSIGPSGGTASRLYFAVVGDTRPAVIDDTKSYPTAIIDKIYSDIAAYSPRPAFVVSTGDYLFASPFGTQATPQLDMYLAARAKYPGMAFPAIGNHECTGAVASNCGPGTTDGVTNNYSAFMSKMLAPIGKTLPYYSIEIDAVDKSWTSKLVFVAGNAWTAAQATWLETTLSKPTTYTFIVRHEPAAATTAPGVSPSEPIMAAHPYTLALVGHTHTYGKTGARQVTIGNGGAPLTGSANYGFALVQQRSDGAIQVDMIDYSTGAFDPAFRFAVKADGSATK